MKQVIILCAIFTIIQCEVPPNFKRCNRKDPNFKKCYFEAAKHGLPQLTRPYKSLGLPNLEPLDVPVLIVKGSGGAVGVDQHFTDCKLIGLTTIKFDKFELDLEKDTLDQEGVAPEITFKCHYNLTGKVLLLPVQGEGNSTVIMKDFHSKSHVKYEKIKKGNKTYYNTLRTDLDLTVSHIHFQYDNLFNGNKQLGDNINQVLNDNWEQIYEEIRPQYVEIVRQVLQGVGQRMWSKLSLEELFDD